MTLEAIINGGALAVLFVFMGAVLKFLVGELHRCERHRDKLEKRLLK